MTQRMKGVVLERIRAGYYTVLTPQGDFVDIRYAQSPEPEIGSEVEFKGFNSSKNRVLFNRFVSTRVLSVAACLLLFFLLIPLGLGHYMAGASQVVTYVSLDINPSLELGINQDNLVVEASGFNDEGRALLDPIAWHKLPIKEVVCLITEEAIKQKYLSEGKENHVFISYSHKQVTEQASEDLAAEVSKIMEAHQLRGQSEQWAVSFALHDEAKMLGVSSGKYVVYQEALEQGLPLTLEDIKGSSMIKAIKEAGGVPGDIISGAQRDKRLSLERDIHNVGEIEDHKTMTQEGQEGTKGEPPFPGPIKGKGEPQGITPGQGIIEPKDSSGPEEKPADYFLGKENEPPNSPEQSDKNNNAPGRPKSEKGR